jgi:hypothetical protein
VRGDDDAHPARLQGELRRERERFESPGKKKSNLPRSTVCAARSAYSKSKAPSVGASGWRHPPQWVPFTQYM